MSKVYNTFSDSAIAFSLFFANTCPFLPKTALNIFPDIITSMLSSSSCHSKNIALSCKGDKFDFIQLESVDRRIRRFFNNPNYDPYLIYDSLIKHVISNFKPKHSDNRIHIIFDHMFKSEDFVVFMLSLRLGKKSIPLWFRCFDDGHSSQFAFKEYLLKEGIKYVSDLFKDFSGCKLIFLADRWFSSPSLLNYIDSLGHTYVIRVRYDHYLFYFDKKENRYVRSKISNLFHYVYKATYYEQSLYTKKKLKTNLVFSPFKSASIKAKSKYESIDEAWALLTNGDVRRAIKDYGYRFGAIEFLFKDQKSNGFNLQKSNTSKRTLQSFSMMYTCINICILYLTCLGTHYTRHKNKLYKDIKIRYYGVVKGKHKRKISVFQVGLTLFKRAMNSLKYIYIPIKFILTDV